MQDMALPLPIWSTQVWFLLEVYNMLALAAALLVKIVNFFLLFLTYLMRMQTLISQNTQAFSVLCNFLDCCICCFDF